MSRSKQQSVFVTPRRPFLPTHVPATEPAQEAPSWFQRQLDIAPGPFAIPAPTAGEAFDSLPPNNQLQNAPLDPRLYTGRVRDVLQGSWVLTLWEVPNGRELQANIATDRGQGITTAGKLLPGTPVCVWTWGEDSTAGRRERLHIAALASSTKSVKGKQRARQKRK